MTDVIFVEDLPAFKEGPRYARKFAQSLLAYKKEEVTIWLDNEAYKGIKGISSNIQYLYEDFQLLGTELSYTFNILNQQIEISLQFYENTSNYWRLFSYTRCNNQVGMVFSVNLSKARIKDGLYELQNKIKFSDRMEGNPDLAKKIRKRKQEVLCNVLVDYGFEVSDMHDVYLGDFSVLNLDGEFINTDLDQFVEDMLTISLLKGHYMGNKGYSLDFLPKLNEK